jgi:2-C-methyl-D-erythritol 4-phosphate cytidylyltransferase
MIAVIVVAAGKGTRMGEKSLPKQFLKIGGESILAHTLKTFDSFRAVDQIVLVARREDQPLCEQILVACGVKKVAEIVEGGKERQDSVLQGLQQVSPDTEIVLIHDAVRMFVTEKMVIESIWAAKQYGASIVAVPAKDTIKQVGTYSVGRSEPENQECADDQNGLFVVKTLDRNTLWQVQTPQTFQYQLLLNIYQQAKELGIYGTDDAMLAEHFGYPVKIVEGSYRNIKITTPDDLVIAQAFLQDSSK